MALLLIVTVASHGTIFSSIRSVNVSDLIEHTRERQGAGASLPSTLAEKESARERPRSTDRHALARTMLSLLPPIATALAQQAVWHWLRPFAWFLFYFAVFVSSWIGGLRGGMLATALSTVLAWWFFVPPVHTFAKAEPRFLVAAAAFAAIGGLISVLQDRVQTARRKAAEALTWAHAGNEKLRQASLEIARLVEQASDGIFVCDRSGRITDVNQAGGEMLGNCREELVDRALTDLMAPAEAERFRLVNQELCRSGVQIGEFRLRRKDGTYLPVELSAKILGDGRLQAIVRDITERKSAELELRRSNRAHRALSRCNTTLVRATDEAELLAQICRIVVEDAGYRFCWVGRGEHDDEKTVRPIAQAGFDESYLERAKITWADDEYGRGPIGTCIRERRTVIARNIATDPRFAPWRAQALQRGYASSIAIPLALDSSTTGAMSIYSSEADAFAEEEVALLSELAGDLAYGIATLRAGAERTRIQHELRSLNAELEQRVLARTAELRAAHEREAETGGKIQQLLLLDEAPRDVRGFAVAALTVPSQRISGDLYGFFHHEDVDCLDVLVADVMGKGVLAALVGAAAKSHFPEALWHLMARSPLGTLPQPKAIVTIAHGRMVRQLIGLESFLTTCYARFDLRRRQLDLVDCGHTGAVHFSSKTDNAVILHGQNLPLGVREGEIYDEISIPLEVGDVIVFFSDGVTEARNRRGEPFGTERLLECVKEHARTDPAALVAAINDATRSFTEEPTPTDDHTCVVVQVVPHEIPIARAKLEIRSRLTDLAVARVFVRGFCTMQLEPPLAEPAVASLELAVNEAASNIMKHAYSGRDDQPIEITAEAYADRAVIRLRHLGKPFEPSAAHAPSFEGSRDSGFGVFLIGKSVDRVRYTRDGLARSVVELEKRRAGH